MPVETAYLPGTEVQLRGLRWEVIAATPMGDQTLLRLRGTGGAFGGSEVDVLTPFEEVRPVIHRIDPTRPTQLPNWLVFHQAFLLEQALGPNALVAASPGRLRIEPYQMVPVARCLRMTRPCRGCSTASCVWTLPRSSSLETTRPTACVRCRHGRSWRDRLPRKVRSEETAVFSPHSSLAFDPWPYKRRGCPRAWR